MLLSNIDEIVPNLYLSNWTTGEDKKKLKKYNIKAVITLQMKTKSEDIIKFYKDNDIQFYHIKINDSPEENIQNYFDSTYNFINENINNGNNVLVHCMAGISRSATIVIHYLLKKEYFNKIIKGSSQYMVNKIIDFVRSKRVFISPNVGFVNKLIQRAEIYSNLPIYGLDISDVNCEGDLRNNKLTSVLMYMKDENTQLIEKFIQLQKEIKNEDIRVYFIKLPKKIPIFDKYEIDREPFVVGFYEGVFFSEYGIDPENSNIYLKLDDLIQYSKEIGNKDVIIHPK